MSESRPVRIAWVRRKPACFRRHRSPIRPPRRRARPHPRGAPGAGHPRRIGAPRPRGRGAPLPCDHVRGRRIGRPEHGRTGSTEEMSDGSIDGGSASSSRRHEAFTALLEQGGARALRAALGELHPAEVADWFESSPRATATRPGAASTPPAGTTSWPRSSMFPAVGQVPSSHRRQRRGGAAPHPPFHADGPGDTHDPPSNASPPPRSGEHHGPVPGPGSSCALRPGRDGRGASRGDLGSGRKVHPRRRREGPP